MGIATEHGRESGAGRPLWSRLPLTSGAAATGPAQAPAGAADPGPSTGSFAPPGTASVPVPILLMLLIVIMVPIEFSFRVGSLMLTPAKVFLVLATLALLPRLARIRFQLFDVAVLAHGFWSAMTTVMIYGGSGIQGAGLYTLEFVTVYLMMRVYMQNLAQFRAVIGLLFILVVISVIAAVPEGLSGQRYIHDFARELTGFRYTYDEEYRLGLLRSASFFEHPILFGLFCSATLGLVWFTSTVSQRMWKAPIIFMGAFFAASSAPLLVFILQMWLIVIERLTRNMKKRVLKFSLFGAGVALILQLTTGRGVVGTIAMLTLNPGTTYIRRTQWQFAIDDVQRHFWFGFDPPTWTRPFWLAPSVDNNWLFMAMRSGVPAVVFLFSAMLLIWLALARRGEAVPPLFSQMRKGWGMMILAVLFVGATVAFFGKLQPLLAFYIGFGAALAACPLPRSATAEGEAPVPDTTRQVRYTRFAGNRPGPEAAMRAPDGPAAARGPAPVYARPPQEDPPPSERGRP